MPEYCSLDRYSRSLVPYIIHYYGAICDLLTEERSATQQIKISSTCKRAFVVNELLVGELSGYRLYPESDHSIKLTIFELVVG